MVILQTEDVLYDILNSYKKNLYYICFKDMLEKEIFYVKICKNMGGDF